VRSARERKGAKGKHGLIWHASTGGSAASARTAAAAASASSTGGGATVARTAAAESGICEHGRWRYKCLSLPLRESRCGCAGEKAAAALAAVAALESETAAAAAECIECTAEPEPRGLVST
jgi:hypothetical protein